MERQSGRRTIWVTVRNRKCRPRLGDTLLLSIFSPVAHLVPVKADAIRSPTPSINYPKPSHIRHMMNTTPSCERAWVASVCSVHVSSSVRKQCTDKSRWAHRSVNGITTNEQPNRCSLWARERERGTRHQTLFHGRRMDGWSLVS